MQVSLSLKSSTPGTFKANLAPCSDIAICGNKNVSFSFEFVDPDALRAVEFVPLQEYVFGGTQMRVIVNNFPSNISEKETMVEFVGLENVTTSVVDRANGKGVLTVNIPEHGSIGAVQVKLHFLSSGIILPFKGKFTYITAPPSIVTGIVPASAAIQTPSRVRISLKNFPRVKTASDVKVRFVWGSVSASASIVGIYSKAGSTKAIQDLDVDVDTPLGPTTMEGSADIVVFHQKHGESLAALLPSGFWFFDTLGPQVKKITGLSGMGVRTISVPMSTSSQIIVLVENVPSDADEFVVEVGESKLDILSADVAVNREARIIFSTFKKSSSGIQHGIVAFGESCSSRCCVDMSCSTICPGVKTACFTVEYVDDSLPMLSVKSDLSGPEVGGDIITLEIVNFPVLKSLGDISVSYQAGDNQEFVDGISIVSSNAESGTMLILVTPNFDGIVSDQTIEFTVEPISNPTRSVSFFYLVQAVQPQVYAFTPSLALSTGGQKVLVEVNYFKYPTDILILFGDVPLPNTFEILSISTRINTKIRFETPQNTPGLYEVVIIPKTCTQPCTQTVRFMFELLDATLPKLFTPIPTGVSFQALKFPPLYVGSVPDYQNLLSLAVRFEGVSSSAHVNVSLGQIEDSIFSGVKIISASIPSNISRAGQYMVSVDFVLRSGISKSSLPFSFFFYDGFLPRVVQVKPLSVPTMVFVGGRKLQLQSTVSVTCMNFPQTLDVKSISAVLNPASQAATVLEIRHEVSCALPLPDCDRSVIVFRMPSLESPGLQELELSQIVAGRGAQKIVGTKVEYVPACDFDRYCQDMGLITNFKTLVEKPNIECSVEFCLDPSLIGVPVILEVLPSEGLKSGGTLVRVRVQNLPAFSLNDVSVNVKSSVSEQIAQVVSLSQTATSSLVSSNGELAFITPRFTANDEFANVQVSVMISGKRKVASFLFEYLPVITGRAVVSSFTPQSIFDGEQLRCMITLENVPKMHFPFNSNEMIVKVSGIEVEKKISSSNRYSTMLMVSGNFASESGQIQVLLGSRIGGERGLGMLHINVTQTPSPRLRSSYPAPDFGVAGNRKLPLQLSAKVEYLSPFLIQTPNLFSVRMFFGSTEYELEISAIVRLMDQTCQQAFCSLVEFQLLVPALLDKDSDTGGTSNINIISSQDSEPISFNFVFRAAGSPMVETVAPGVLSLSQAEQVKLFLKHFPTSDCSANTPPSCSEDAVARGLFIEFDDLLSPGQELALEDSNGMLVVTFPAPISERSGAEVGRLILLESEIPPLEFSLEYKMPAARVTPLDGRVSGKQTITITARGWWGNGKYVDSLPSKDAIILNIGGTRLNPSDIISVAKKDLDLVVYAMTPVSKVVGTVSCSISAFINGMERVSRFTFDYYISPVVKGLRPEKATLAGKTTSEDGISVLLTVANFPSVSSAGELLLTVGEHQCGQNSACGITEIKTSQEKDGPILFIRVRIPSASAPGTRVIRVQPAVKRPDSQLKFVETALSYYKPLPVISSVRWCRSCTIGSRTCIVMGKCGGVAPVDSLIPMFGGGFVIVVLENPPDFTFVENGDVAISGTSTAMIALSLGNGIGKFARVAYGDGKANKNGNVEKSARVALEFKIPELFSVAGSSLVVTIHPLGAIAPSSASALVSFYDDKVEIFCLEGCKVPARGGNAIISVKNLPLNLDSAAVGQIDASFGFFQALSLDFDQSYAECRAESICLRLGVPSCKNCKYNLGAFLVDVSVSLKGNPMIGAKTSLTYYGSPIPLSAKFDSMGTSIQVLFDQNTDMGGIFDENHDCMRILDALTVELLATNAEDASCVWESMDSLNIFLGSGARISPGDSIVIQEDTLRSSNKISDPCLSNIAVSAPAFAVAPVVVIMGTNEIDPCADLELRAMVDSPRPLVYSWSCRNDEVLDQALRSVVGALLYLDSGTKEMPDLNKNYEVLVVATNFLGISSAPVLFSVLKKGSPAPLLNFMPPQLSMHRDESQLIKVVATFSKCPIEKGKLMFTWSLLSAPEDSGVHPQVFTATGAQLLIPKGVLEAGSTYTLGVQAFLDNDPSKSSSGTYTINVNRRPLVATISGGSKISASFSREFVLDGSGSLDPDFHGGPDPGMQFSWSCMILDGDIANPCRTKPGANLELAGQSVVKISESMLAMLFPTAENPYIFTVSVSKASSTPVSFSMPVSLTEAAIPAVTIRAGSGKRTPSGVIRINPDDQVVLFGDCSVFREDLAHNFMLTWSFVPAISKEFYKVMSDPNVTKITERRQTLIVGAGTVAFMAGSSYLVEVRCTDSVGKSEVSTLSLSVNAPPRGDPCFVCRLAGTSCANDEPKQGKPIFDTFRYSCPSWADTDAPLQYQFMYTGTFDGEYTEVIFDWRTLPMVDLILPPGEISVLARVRDSFGGSTEWMDGGRVFVASAAAPPRRRNLLETTEQWSQAEQTLRETLGLADYSKINQLVGALAMQINTQVANADDSTEMALFKKETLLQLLRTAVISAIKTEGFVCESLSVGQALSSNIDHISVNSVLHLANIIGDLSASESALTLSSDCAHSMLKLMSSALEATSGNSTCTLEGVVNSDQQRHMPPFLNSMEASLEHMLRKSSTPLFVGQKMALQSPSGSTNFSYSVSRMSPAGNIDGTLAPLGGTQLEFSYNIPEEVRQDTRLSSQSSISVLFGTLAHPPAVAGINPISASVTLSLGDNNGNTMDMSDLSHPVNITIPISGDGLCVGEKHRWSGLGRCLYYDTATGLYSSNGCTTHQTSEESVTCMCSHLTSFVVEVFYPPNPYTRIL